MFHRRAGRRPKAPRILATVATLGMLITGGPVASADPSSPPSPSIDASAPTPTAPYPAGPPQGFGPDGITIGGPGLDTRARVQAPGTPALPGGIDAKGWVIADATSGQILAAQDPHGRYYPASTLKLLTMTTLYPLLDPNQILTATHEDASVEGSRVGIVENGQYTVAQLWNALVLQSGNDAAQMLAEGAGGVSKSLSLMNAKAKELQAYDTIAGTVSGLDVSGQSSSPYDLCIFLREIISNPATLKIAGELTGQLPPVPPKYGPLNYSTQDKLLTHQYPGALGGKTGFTDAARHTFVGAAAQNGRTLIVSLMQAEQTPVQTWQQAAALLDWGFSTPATTSGLGKLVVPGEVSEQPASVSESIGSSAPALSDGAGTPVAETTPRSHGVPLWPAIPILVLLVGGAIWIAAPVHSKNKKKPKDRRH
ncbi:D-alanyl-D-alanine carboxypeptidase (penicillin-binding protein 5/6) [Antricoccus suffuscus]|uniref:D-alanyl-D-alanine carboxypeptidase (Penicillin-binding protein 5/6) n=1 Tax=Antricoccus suffuscus TaxID=1629062 RepID=A0A2T0ZFW7_9ACTN|nr:serine hydrolase [Antricoccus suffuscus]PRZ35233.1 D-alanyl-D-alanine carboxypeptidase (penicillin-binding protein 5/6) [Antricoccus suffuscus]